MSRLLLFVIAVATPVPAQGREAEIDSAIDNDPSLALPPPVRIFSPKLKPLWLKALARPEADLQRQAAETISRAHLRGMKGLEETAPALRKVLAAGARHPSVRLAAARALIALNARQSAALLFKHVATEGLAFSQLAEPALAKWDFKPIRKVWLARLKKRESTRTGVLRLAIRCVAVVRDTRASSDLWTLISGASPRPQLRLDAARALGRIQQQGLVARAAGLARDTSSGKIVDRLAAALLLVHHDDAAARKLLLQLATDPQPAVATIALQRLLTIAPQQIIPLAQPLLANRDANVRRLTARALMAQPDMTAVKRLASLLNDPHPTVRRTARQLLRKLAEMPKLAAAVRSETFLALQKKSWRAQEQAALLLGALEEKPAADRLVELLESTRPEVMIASAWALRKLAVRATLPAIFNYASRKTARILRGNRLPLQPGLDGQSDQMFQMFGLMNYVKAAPLLRQYVPKNFSFGEHARGAAIWALGKMNAGRPSKGLSAQLVVRISDIASLPPELSFVRAMAAVTLGRMQAKETLPTLRRFYREDTTYSEIGLACRWAIKQISGKDLPGAKPRRIVQTGWFLEPLQYGRQKNPKSKQ